jgi:RNA polymerase sigma-70 factor (ECF subfamily)
MVYGYYPVDMPRLEAASSRALFRVIPGGVREGASDGLFVISDEELIAGVQRGDTRVASELCRRVVDAVDHTLYRVVGQRGPEHDDLVQQSFEQIVVTLTRRTFAQGCSLRTWASRIATNVGLNALRSRMRERVVVDRTLALDPGFDVHGGPDPFGMLEARAELGQVQEQLAEMNPRRVEILLLHDVLGHGLREISHMLRMSRTAVQSRLFRGRRELRQRLEALGMGPEKGRS